MTSQLCIRLDTRCCLPPGHRLIIEHVLEDYDASRRTAIAAHTGAKGAMGSPAALAGNLAASLAQLGASPTAPAAVASEEAHMGVLSTQKV